MNQAELQAKVSEVAESTGVPGAAVGVRLGDEQHYAVHGVTSVEDPLPVTERTLFQIGSTTKTYTATAIMRLVAQGRVDLDERVRAYLPSLRLADEQVAAQVTVGTLLNHTAGWDGGDEIIDTGEGDDALARYVETMAELPQRTPPGTAASYNNAAVVLAGRVIEKVTGETYERALRELVLDPLGLDMTLLFPAEVMEHRFSASHVQDDDGKPTVFRPWAAPRGVSPAGRIAATIADLLAYAAFHLGDGAPLMPMELLQRMQRPSTEHELFPGTGIGLAWWLRDIEGVRIVEHPGDGAGQKSAFTLVPDRDFAVAVLVNCVPNGQETKDALVRWALEEYLDLVEPEPVVLELAPDELAQYAGTYTTDAARMDVTVAGSRLDILVRLTPGGGEPPSSINFPVGMLDGEGFVVVDGPYKGLQGYFVRENGAIVSLHHIGRLSQRAG
jgi:CubicO group peptidase (beta-lactamase class C family)